MPQINKILRYDSKYPDLRLVDRVTAWLAEGKSRPWVAEQVNTLVAQARGLAELPPAERVQGQNVGRLVNSPGAERVEREVVKADRRRQVKAAAVRTALHLTALEKLNRLEATEQTFMKHLSRSLQEEAGGAESLDEALKKLSYRELLGRYEAWEAFRDGQAKLIVAQHQITRDTVTLEMAGQMVFRVLSHAERHLGDEQYLALLDALAADPQLRPLMVAMGLVDSKAPAPGDLGDAAAKVRDD